MYRPPSTEHTYLWGEALRDAPGYGAAGEQRGGRGAVGGAPFKHLLDEVLKLVGIMRWQRAHGPLTYFEDKAFPTICLKLKSKIEL